MPPKKSVKVYFVTSGTEKKGKSQRIFCFCPCVNCVLKVQPFFLNLSSRVLPDFRPRDTIFNVMEICARSICLERLLLSPIIVWINCTIAKTPKQAWNGKCAHRDKTALSKLLYTLCRIYPYDLYKLAFFSFSFSENLKRSYYCQGVEII